VHTQNLRIKMILINFFFFKLQLLSSRAQKSFPNLSNKI